MNGNRDNGGSRISETKEVTTVVKAAAILCSMLDWYIPSGEMRAWEPLKSDLTGGKKALG